MALVLHGPLAVARLAPAGRAWHSSTRSSIPIATRFHSFVDYSDEVIARLPGVIVPQKEYRPPAGQAAFNRLPNIVIRRTNGGYGINLRDVLAGNAQDLHAAHSIPHVSDTGMRVTLRIHWPGYQDWRFENGIDVFDHTHNANPQTLERIVQKVARLVRTFYDEMRVNGSREQDWCLDRINFDDLYLVELRQVSKGSWQPVICWSAA